jgi:hypothetical protein
MGSTVRSGVACVPAVAAYDVPKLPRSMTPAVAHAVTCRFLISFLLYAAAN